MEFAINKASTFVVVQRVFMIDNIVLFDGLCSLCNTSVDFIVRNEKDDILKFASLQSEVGKTIVQKSELKEVPDSILFYSKGVMYTESTAALHIAQYLKRPFSWLAYLRVIPRPIRDVVYRLIARNRYKWFGKRDTCRVPTAAERDKLLG